MKTKAIVTGILLLSAFTSKAQILKGGVNFANVTITNDGDIDRNKMLTSFQVGFSGDVKIASCFYFQPGIVFTGKGSKTESGNTTDPNYYRATTNPYYIEIQANFVVKSPGKDFRLFAGAGPYLAVGIAGKNTADGKVLGTSFHHEENIKWSNDDPTTLNYEEGAGYGVMKRFDYGLNGIAGIETQHIVLAAGYGFGLAKLQSGSNSSADDKNKHRVLSLTLGIKL